MNNAGSKETPDGMGKRNLRGTVSWVLCGVLVVIFCIFTINFMSVSCRSAEAVRMWVDDACQSSSCRCTNPSDTPDSIVCPCRRPAIDDTDSIKEHLAELSGCADKLFDSNVVTFLVSFSLIAILTLLLQEKDKLHELSSKFQDDIKKSKAESDSLKKSIEKERRLFEYNYLVQGIVNDCTLYTHIIISSDYKVEKHILQAIETTYSRVTEANMTIHEYNEYMPEEYLYTENEIANIYNSLDSIRERILALMSEARKFFASNNGEYDSFRESITPLYDSIQALQNKFESYYRVS